MGKVFTTFEISKICSVDISTVSDWIDKNKLPAYRTPGGHRRVKAEDLIEFLKKYNMPLPEELLEEPCPIKILIVDDNTSIQRFFIKLLQELMPDATIETAIDGFEAGLKVISFMPDLIILDLMLPGINGFKVCSKIKNNKLTDKIKIIAVTGYASEENKKKILECGADEFISKPVNIEEFRKILEKLTEEISKKEKITK